MALKGVAQETLQWLEAGAYRAPSGTMRTIAAAQRAAVEGTRLYTPEQLASHLAGPIGPGGSPQVEVWACRTQEAARRLVQDEGSRIALLNFASARNPGGGFLNGAKAQEEDVARCSGIYPCLLTQPTYYDVNRRQSSLLYTDHAIWSPEVPFFRVRSRSTIELPFTASVITAPAPNAGQFLRRQPEGRPALRRALRRRAGHVLAAAAHKGVRTMLLGAWGCGVFRNDPHDVASAFADWLVHPRFAGVFDRVVFGVFDRTRGRTVLAAFEARFGAGG